MPNNELSYKDYPDGTRAYFRDDTARGGVADLTSALANLDNLKATEVATIDGTPQNLFTLFKGLAKSRLHIRRITGTQSASSMFGGSSFTVIGAFSSNNYGWILCLSDNAACGFKHIAVNEGTVAYVQTPTVTVTQYTVS